MMHKEEIEHKKGDVEFIEGEFINIKQSSIRAVEGGHIELQQVCALSIDAEKADVTQGASVILRGNDITLNQGISAVTAGDNVSMNFSFSPMTISREQTMVNRSAVGIMASRNIKSESTSSLLVLASKIEGNVTTLLDWRSALAFGAVLGGTLGFVSLLFKRR
ncbi:MAG: hypothetical protein OEZ31_08600 [Nitrospirota bacterium]|nr:hypothetical protein [Nitrospirota bacterium]MDH5769000.1 hypothetical protein [Nitrospirota bacterium]